jgi:hypothetical protein
MSLFNQLLTNLLDSILLKCRGTTVYL